MASTLLDHLLSPEGVVCARPEDTRRLGEALAGALTQGSVLSLEGPLGAGKTHFTGGVVKGLGCDGEASSPSFALMHEYAGGKWPVFHFDFYRLKDEEELLTSGFDDCVPAGVTVAEWGDKFPQVFPPGTLRLKFSPLPGGERRITGAKAS
jgi:tRNA threonylcarbamoyladenosine biosynthesis protein TsaE